VASRSIFIAPLRSRSSIATLAYRSTVCARRLVSLGIITRRALASCRIASSPLLLLALIIKRTQMSMAIVVARKRKHQRH